MKFPYIIAAVLMAAPALAGDNADCGKAVTQFDMNQCADKDFQAADKTLNEVYKKVVAAQEGDSTKLKAAQRAWITFRDAECSFEIADNEGGTIYPMMYSMCLTKVTKARIAQFNAYLACEKDASKC